MKVLKILCLFIFVVSCAPKVSPDQTASTTAGEYTDALKSSTNLKRANELACLLKKVGFMDADVSLNLYGQKGVYTRGGSMQDYRFKSAQERSDLFICMAYFESKFEKVTTGFYKGIWQIHPMHYDNAEKTKLNRGEIKCKLTGNIEEDNARCALVLYQQSGLLPWPGTAWHCTDTVLQSFVCK